MKNKVHVPGLWRVGDVDANNNLSSNKIDQKGGEKDAQNEPHGVFLWLLVVTNEHKELLMFGHRERSSGYPG